MTNLRRRNGLLVSLALAVLIALVGLTLTQVRSAAKPPGPASPHHRVAVATQAPEAAGVDNGSKEQGSGVKMHSIPTTNPNSIAGKYGEFGGCVPGYGRSKAQCLPPISPAASGMGMTAEEHPWDCGEVRKIFPKGIKLDKAGKDPLRLDYNKDGVACGTGD